MTVRRIPGIAAAAVLALVATASATAPRAGDAPALPARAEAAPTLADGLVVALVSPVDPDRPPRVARKGPRGALSNEARRWLLQSRPAGEVLSLPLPARESLPVFLPDAE